MTKTYDQTPQIDFQVRTKAELESYSAELSRQFVAMNTDGRLHWIDQDGAYHVTSQKANVASVDPGAGDDINDGYYPLSIWINQTDSKAFLCLDSTAGAAVWLEIKDTAGALLASAFGSNSILKSDTSGNPVSLPVEEDRIIGRQSGGVISSLTGAQAAGIIGAFVKATDTASDVKITQGGASVRDVFNDYIGHGWDSGHDSLTDNGNGTVTFNAGTGYLRTTQDTSGPVDKYTISGATLSLTDNATNWIYQDYNGGSPVLAVSTVPGDVRGRQDRNVVKLIDREGSDIRPIDAANGWRSFHTIVAQKWSDEAAGQGYRSAQRLDGAVIATVGTRNLYISPGIFWGSTFRTVTQEIDTSSGDTAVQWWGNASVGFTSSVITQTNNAQYFNGTSLASLGVNRYGVRWEWLLSSGDQLHQMIVDGNYVTEDEARTAADTAPVDIPPRLSRFGTLIGRKIVRQGTDTVIDLPLFENPLTEGGAVAHRDVLAPNEVKSTQHVYFFGSFAAMSGTEGFDGQLATLSGYYANGDGGGGSFVYSTSLGPGDVNGITVVSGGAGGCWVRVSYDKINVKWAGVKGDYNGTSGTDDSIAFQAAVDFCAASDLKIYVPSGGYLLNNITIDSTKTDIDIEFDHQSYIWASDNATDIFDITGQRRIYWKGGWFKRARRCLSSEDTTIANAWFSEIYFSGDSAGAIQVGYYSHSSIGVWFENCNFGGGGAVGSIVRCCDFAATYLNQTNVNHFINCLFIEFNEYGLYLRPSIYTFSNFSVKNCWFEDSPGIGISAGNSCKSLSIEESYFENIGGATHSSIELTNVTDARVKGCFFAAPATGITSWIKVDGGNSYIEENHTFISGGNFVFVDYSNIVTPHSLWNTTISATNDPDYKSALFSIDDADTEYNLKWNIFRYSVQTSGDDYLDMQLPARRLKLDGHIIHKCADATLTDESTWYNVATINLPMSSGCVVEVEMSSLHNDIAFFSVYIKFLCQNDQGTISYSMIDDVALGTGLELGVNAVTNGLQVRARRVGVTGALSIVSPIVKLFQGQNNILTRRITISDPA